MTNPSDSFQSQQKYQKLLKHIAKLSRDLEQCKFIAESREIESATFSILIELKAVIEIALRQHSVYKDQSG